MARDAVDDVLQHARADQASRAGHPLQGQHAEDGSPVLLQQRAEMTPRGVARRHGEDGRIEVGLEVGGTHAPLLVTSLR